MQCHPKLRDAVCSRPLRLSDLTEDQKHMVRCILEIMRQYDPQFGSINITIMAGKAQKFAWTDTITIK